MPDNVFDVVLATNGFVEFCRVVTLLLGIVVFIFGTHRFLTHQLGWSAIAAMGVGLLTSVQEISVIGEPLYPWRLLLLALITVATLVYLYDPVRHR